MAVAQTKQADHVADVRRPAVELRHKRVRSRNFSKEEEFHALARCC